MGQKQSQPTIKLGCITRDAMVWYYNTATHTFFKVHMETYNSLRIYVKLEDMTPPERTSLLLRLGELRPDLRNV